MSNLKVLPFSQLSSLDSIRMRPLKIRGEVTFSKRLQSSIAPCVELPESLLSRLRRLDREQLQVVEIVIAAIERGAR
jgi:hypothetical protein